MRKIYSLFLALLVSVVAFADLNPYAYALSSQLSADETTLTVNYSLNATATSVKVVVLNGETVVKTIDCTEKGLTKGAYTLEISTADFPKNANLTWRVDVTGAEVTTATAVKGYMFYRPFGVDIDNNPESAHFGRILCAETYTSANTKYASCGLGSGIYEYNPAFELVPNGTKPGYNGGKTFSNDDHSPYRVSISDDGRIFVTAHDQAGDFLWEVNPDNLNEWTSVFHGATHNADQLKDASGNFIVGTNAGFDVYGSGSDLKLLMLSCNKLGTAVATFQCHEYNLGVSKTWTTVPSRKIDGCQLNSSMIARYSQVQYDKDGGFWCTYYVNSTILGGMAHFTKDGVKDYEKHGIPLRAAGFCFNYDYTKVVIAGNDIFGTTKETSKAVVYCVSKDSDGKPILSKETIIDMAAVGGNLNDFAWDYAGNIYAVGNSGEYLYAYALPHAADAVVSTPAASRYAFQLKEGELYTLSVVVNNEEGTVTGAGSYLEGETATLTATANRGYKFASWTVGEETITENPLTITVNANTTITANFEALVAYTITAAANDATMGTVEGAGTYYAGETVTLKAVANDGHHFVNWSNEATTETITFEAAEDATLTANFAKNIYTLTVNVNDSEKGSVDKATATYEFGTEVTLTATPAAGCELLAWSDRSTAQTLTITMDADKAVTVYFVTSYVNEPEFKVEKVWEYTTDFPGTGNGYQAVGRDGVIYVQDAGNSRIKTITAEGITEYANSGVGQQIAIDNVGNLIVLNHTFYNSPTNVLIYKKGETEGKAVAFALKNPARCDFFSASGDIFSAEGGYIYFYCNGKTVVNRLKITNGAVAAEDVTTDVVGNITAANNNQNHVMVDIWGNLVAHARSTALNSIDVATNISKAFTLPQFKISTVGGCSFELAGKEFWAYNFGTTNYNSEWSLYNMTDAKSIADTTFYTKDRTSTNSAANWLNVQVIDEKTAYIYQFCPKVGAAVWKVTANFPKPNTPEILFDEEVATVYINASEGNAVIYYDWTIDAEVAVGEETKYTEPIALDPSTAATYQIEAIAILDGEMSDIATATFEIKANGETVNLESVGALAVVYSHDGNLYVQTEVGTLIEVYTVQGQRIYAAEAITDVTTIELDETVVLVRIADQTVKAYIKK